MPRTANDYTAYALDAFNAGFSSKAAQKGALDNLNRAYEFSSKAIHDALLADRSIGGDLWTNLYYNVPSLHNWKPHHNVSYGFMGADAIQSINDLVELRATIKAAVVNPPAPREVSKYEVAAVKSIQTVIALAQSKYARGINLSEIFGGLQVHANTHQVTNEHGTTFLRTFYYMFGELTPLNVIIAAAEELARREEAA